MSSCAEIFYVFAGNERWSLIPLSQVTAIEVNAAA